MFVSNFRARASVLAAASAALFVGCSADSPEQQTRFEPPPPASAAPGGSLLGAVRSGRIDAVRDLLGQGADVNASAADGTTALIEAVGARQSEIADLLLEAGADPNAVNRYGMSALHLAARDADASSVEVLLAAGADPSVALPEGETVLMAAAKSGDPAILRALLESGSIADGASYGSATRVVNAPDPNAREGWYGQTALMWAAAGGHAEAMRLLIEAGAEVDQASSRIAAPEIEPERRQGGFVYASIPEGRLTALHFAAREGQLDAVRTLIDAGANLDLGDSYGTTPLVLATLNGHLGVAAALLEAGADPNIQDQYGRTALFVATDLNTIDVNPRPPPPITGDYRPVDIVQMALEHGADVDLTLSEKGLPAWVAQGGAHNPMLADGATAFFRAAMSGDLEIMNLLLEAGADPLVVTAEQPCRLPRDQCQRSTYMAPDGQTTAFMAAAGVGWRLGISRGREADAIEALEMLLELGADINAKNQTGNTALHGAATRQSATIIEFLVDHGADLAATNAKGWTPLDIALGQPDFRIPANDEIAALLRRLMAEHGISETSATEQAGTTG